MKEKYCGTCGEDFSSGELSVRCRLCMRNYHASCWEKAGGCTTYGCAGKNELEKDKKIKLKRCPECGEEIADFAVRCRYCRFSLIDGGEINAKMKGPLRKESGASRKDPILTCLLNLLFPGAGYMYLGQFNKGLFWFLIAVAAYVFLRPMGGPIAVYLWVMYDSARQAVAINRGGPPPGAKSQQRR